MQNSTVTRDRFVEAARAYLGAPFRHQGRDRRGVDCLGLIVCAARDIGIEVRDNLNYRREPDLETMRAGLLEHFTTIARGAELVGDVLWLRWPRRAYPAHLAIVTETDPAAVSSVLHADGDHAKQVTEQPIPDAWRPRVVHSLRWRGFV